MNNTRPYSPTPAVNSFPELQQELSRIADVFEQLTNYIPMGISNRPPTKPVLNQLVYADGTNWNPGNGAGYYFYSNGAWVKLVTE